MMGPVFGIRSSSDDSHSARMLNASSTRSANESPLETWLARYTARHSSRLSSHASSRLLIEKGSFDIGVGYWMPRHGQTAAAGACPAWYCRRSNVDKAWR